MSDLPNEGSNTSSQVNSNDSGKQENQTPPTDVEFLKKVYPSSDNAHKISGDSIDHIIIVTKNKAPAQTSAQSAEQNPTDNKGDQKLTGKEDEIDSLKSQVTELVKQRDELQKQLDAIKEAELTSLADAVVKAKISAKLISEGDKDKEVEKLKTLGAPALKVMLEDFGKLITTSTGSTESSPLTQEGVGQKLSSTDKTREAIRSELVGMTLSEHGAKFRAKRTGETTWLFESGQVPTKR